MLGLLLILAVCQTVHAQTATVNWPTTYQTIQGFGAYNGFVGTAMNSYDPLLFQTLGYSLLRSAVPLGNGTCDGSPSASCATGQDSVTDMQACVANGCKEWLSVSNPPGEYNTSGTYNCTASAALNPSAYQPFAEYITNYIASLNAYEGVSVYGISAQNEPDNTDGCQMSASQFDTFISQNLGPTLASNGQSNTTVMLPETETYGDLTSWAGTCMSDSNCSKYVGVAAFHNYGGNGAGATPPPYSVPLWETEVTSCCGVPAPIGNWSSSMSDALFWANMVDAELSSGVSAWSYFWYVDDDTTYGTDSNSALINPAQNPAVSTRTYAIANWAKFVRPGWVRIDATHAPVGGVTITAFKNSSTGDFVVVAVNTNNSNSSITFALSGFPGSPSSVTPWVTSSALNLAEQSNVTVGGGSFAYALPANSVTSFVGNTTTSSTSAAPTAPTGLTAAVE